MWGVDSFVKTITDAANKISNTVKNVVQEAVLTEFSGYRMVHALPEGMLNDALHRAHAHNSPSSHALPWKLIADDQSWYVIVEEFDSPQIDFDTPITNGARLTIRVKRGTFNAIPVAAPGEIPKIQTQQIDGMTIRATVQVSRIRHKGWTGGGVSAASLFTDLENVEQIEASVDSKLKTHTSVSVDIPISKLIHDQLKSTGKDHPLRRLFGQYKLHDVPTTARESYFRRVIRVAGILFTVSGREEFKPTGHTYSTTVVRHSNGTYNYGILNVLMLIQEQRSFPKGDAAGRIDRALAPKNRGRIVISDAAILEKYGKPDALKRYAKIPLIFHRGRDGKTPARYYIDKTWNFGVTVSGRGRNAYMGKFELCIRGSEIAYSGYYNTSRFRVFGDKKFQVSLNDDRVPLLPATVPIPGNEVFKIGNIWLQGHLYADVIYK